MIAGCDNELGHSDHDHDGVQDHDAKDHMDEDHDNETEQADNDNMVEEDVRLGE